MRIKAKDLLEQGIEIIAEQRMKKNKKEQEAPKELGGEFDVTAFELGLADIFKEMEGD